MADHFVSRGFVGRRSAAGVAAATTGALIAGAVGAGGGAALVASAVAKRVGLRALNRVGGA